MLELFCFSTDFDENLTGNKSLSETFISGEFFLDILIFHIPLEPLSKIIEIEEDKFQKSKIYMKKICKRTFRRSPSFHQKISSQADLHNYFSQLDVVSLPLSAHIVFSGKCSML